MTITTVIAREPLAGDLASFAGLATVGPVAGSDRTWPFMRVRTDAKHTGRAGNRARRAQGLDKLDYTADVAPTVEAYSTAHAADRATTLALAMTEARSRAVYQSARDAYLAHCREHGLPATPPRYVAPSATAFRSF
jgi:hypothetical protein